MTCFCLTAAYQDFVYYDYLAKKPSTVTLASTCRVIGADLIICMCALSGLDWISFLTQPCKCIWA